MTEELIGGGFSVISSLISAFAGGGGTLILLGGLVTLFPAAGYLPALTITKVSAAILTATSGFMHSERQKIDVKMAVLLTIYGTIGVAIATYLLQYKIDESYILKLIPILIFGIVIYLASNGDKGSGKNRKKAFTKKEYIEASFFSFAFSIISGMIAGLGPIFVAYFVIRFKTSFIETIAYMMISGTIINVLQSSYLLWTVDVNLLLLLIVIIGSLLGSYFGTILQYKVGNRLVKTAALLTMTAMGIYMLF